MKLVFLIRSLQSGGAERQLAILAQALHAHGEAVTVVVFYPGGPYEHELREAGVPVRVIGKRGRWDLVSFYSRLLAVIRAEAPDVLHAYTGVPNVLAVSLKPFLAGVRVVWGVRSAYMDLARYGWLAQLAYRVECRLSPFADLIIANSQAGHDHAVQNGFPAEKVVVVPNGIDTRRFRPDTEAGRAVRAGWGITENERLVGLVGRLDPMKDHRTFLRAAATLADRPGLRFVCVGGGPDSTRQTLEAMATELGLGDRVIWAGARFDMPAVYNALDVMVSASYGEGFPNVLAEAMACGVPCVATDVGDSATILGEQGVLVSPRDPGALAEGIKRLLAAIEVGDVRRQGCVDHIVARFTVDRLRQRTLDALGHVQKEAFAS